MDVKSGYPWWPVRNGLLHQYPPLREDCDCEVAVIGAGITGALIADALVDADLDIIVLDKRDVGWGSTSASTALLQYEIDTELVDLGKQVGESNALRAYKACETAVRQLGEIAAGMGDIGYQETGSLYFASSPRHAKRLRDEFVARRSNGFGVEWLNAASVRERFGFDAPAALLSRPAAQVDPYRLAHALLARARARGLRVFDRSPVSEVKYEGTCIRLLGENGVCVRARHVIIAGGYETEAFVPEKLARNRSSYAFVSEPLDPMPEFLKEVIAWETARPYLYWRSTEDGRLVIGGQDDAIDNPLKRDLRVSGKCAKLLNRMGKLFPGLRLQVGFAWAGTFAETEDGLPYFGTHPECDPRVQFAMAYGGNGITYSTIGAGIVRDAILGRTHELGTLFGFCRKKL